jgi:hypothetical protein
MFKRSVRWCTNQWPNLNSLRASICVVGVLLNGSEREWCAEMRLCELISVCAEKWVMMCLMKVSKFMWLIKAMVDECQASNCCCRWRTTGEIKRRQHAYTHSLVVAHCQGHAATPRNREERKGEGIKGKAKTWFRLKPRAFTLTVSEAET